MTEPQPPTAIIVITVVASWSWPAIGLVVSCLGRSTIAPPTTTPSPSRHAHRSQPQPVADVRADRSSGLTRARPPTRRRPSPAKAAAKTGPAGLPLGYAHDQTGAVNAATNYLMWMNSLKIVDKNVRR